MERYEVSFCIQSESGKIRTRKNSVFGHISRSDNQKLKQDSLNVFLVCPEIIIIYRRDQKISRLVVYLLQGKDTYSLA